MSRGDYPGGPGDAGSFDYGPVRPPRWPAGCVVALAVFALLGGALDLLFSFGMLFATDSCGTGAGHSAAVCSGGGWLLLLALPWAGLAAGLLLAVLGGERLRRRHLSPWRAVPVGVAVYLLVCVVTGLLLFG
ncbi:hypothetical protein GXW82_17485 [Streptacidiphilus sp. 4-A2]|nr:hypothetical protein [Streptacidiphilus sp. 4-A2]